MTTRAGRRAAFIGRDGVIDEEREYVSRVEDFQLLPGAIQGLALLRDAGLGRCVLVESGHAVSSTERQTADARMADLEAAARWLTAAT